MTAITYRQYTGEPDLPHIISLVEHELSEPYVIYTYRYFLNQWYASPLSPFPTKWLTPPQAASLLPSEPCSGYYVIIVSHPPRECSLNTP